MKVQTVRSRIATIDTSAAKAPRKEADPHYNTQEHRDWRQLVMTRAGWRCQWDGCDQPARYADHIIERRDGGADLDPSNGQALCATHHVEKTVRERARRHAR